jgi:hypothetical protein
MELPIFDTYINSSCHHFCCFTVAPLFVLDKSTAWNRCLQHPCFKNLCKISQASKNSNSNAQRFLLDMLTHSQFHSMLFALPSYQIPYLVMNRCFYLTRSRWREKSIWMTSSKVKLNQWETATSSIETCKQKNLKLVIKAKQYDHK